MSIPVTHRQQIIVSSTGDENRPVGVVAKSSFWVFFESFEKIYVKEFEGSVFYKVWDQVPKFYVTSALDDSLTLEPDRVWLWSVEVDGRLILYEIEPFTDAEPTVHRTTVIASDISDVVAEVVPGQAINNLLLNTAGSSLSVRYSTSPFLSSPKVLTDGLDWAASRYPRLSLITTESGKYLYDFYGFHSSPDNIQYEVWEFFPPEHLVAMAGVEPKDIDVLWDAKEGADSYVLERSHYEDFSDTVVVYSGTSTEFLDEAEDYGITYYYRVKAVSELGFESNWSDTATVEVEKIVIKSYRSWISNLAKSYSPLEVGVKYLPYIARTLGYDLKSEDFLVSVDDTAKKRVQIKELGNWYRLKGTNRSFAYIFDVLEGTSGVTDLGPELAWVKVFDASWNFIQDPRDYTTWIPLNYLPDDEDPSNPGNDFISDYAVSTTLGPNYISDSRLRLSVEGLSLDVTDKRYILDRLDEVKPYHLVFDFTYVPEVNSKLYETFSFEDWPVLYHDDAIGTHDSPDLPDYYSVRGGGPDVISIRELDVDLLTSNSVGNWIRVIPT